jgi:hypothetical protein
LEDPAPSHSSCASREVDAPGSFICKPLRSSLGSLRRRALSPVSKPGFLDFSRPAVCSSLLRLRAHPSLIRLLFRVPSPTLLARNLSTSSFTCLGFRPSWRHHARAATDRETSQVPLRSVLGFRNRSTVLSARSLAGLFHPAATSRVQSVQGPSLPAQPPILIGRSIPPCRCCIVARSSPSTRAEVDALPRAMPLGFEAFVRAKPRSASPVIHLARSRSLLQFRLLQVPSSPDVSTRLPGTFRSWCSRDRCSRSPSASYRRESSGRFVSEPARPARVFEPSHPKLRTSQARFPEAQHRDSFSD